MDALALIMTMAAYLLGSVSSAVLILVSILSFLALLLSRRALVTCTQFSSTLKVGKGSLPRLVPLLQLA